LANGYTRVKKVLQIGLITASMMLVACVEPKTNKLSQEASSGAKVETINEEDIIECAALMAVHIASEQGELKEGSKTQNLIGFGLGKAQELVQQQGGDVKSVRARYDQKIFSYFMQYSEDKTGRLNANAPLVRRCEERLSQYEPEAQIQQALDKAKAMAK